MHNQRGLFFKIQSQMGDAHCLRDGHLLNETFLLPCRLKACPCVCSLHPPGATQTPERKVQIYAICRRFGLLILEDDPYYYLQYTPGQPPQGLQGLGKSYLALDIDHRVMRLDSFSKARPQIL